MSNRLTDAVSPYLQQHAENPVDWWPWCDEAFELARERDVPVLLSVGYAACHWCHVMARESFEDPAVAQVLNEGFVNIKVDREERPDVDAVYMAATSALTGRGGWPMTVFLDHDRQPFYAGTYFPPEPRHGMPSFPMVLAAITDAWVHRRGDVLTSARQISEELAGRRPQRRGIDDGTTRDAVRRLHTDFDRRFGGFGAAPKFPQPMVHEFLLRHHARTGDPDALAMVETTLTAMVSGGMYDQLAGGFARYSVDDRWLVPHFEKMLYDNALLLRVYLHWWRATGSDVAGRVVTETADFLLGELLTPQGGFAASLDADSQGREGAFYVWTPQQVRQAGGDPTRLGVGEPGSFEGDESVLQAPGDYAQWPSVREHLREVREQRPRPARDDKVVLAWNAWAVSALAEAGALLQRPEWLQAAVECRNLLWSLHRDGDQWLRVSRDGVRGSAGAVLEDYASIALAEFTLASVTGSSIEQGLAVAHRMVELFVDPHRDSLAAGLPATGPDMTDNATPSGWSLAAEALLVASALSGDGALRERAVEVLERAGDLARHPQFWGHGLGVLEALLDGPLEVAVIGETGGPMHRAALSATRPGAVVAVSGPLTDDRPRVEGRETAYVCREFVCDAPTVSVDDLRRRLAASG